MAKKILLIALVVLLAVSFTVAAQAKKKIVHYHWTETLYDPINKKAADLFMAQNPNVEVVVLYLPDSDRRNIIRTVLAGGGSIDSFALNNGETAEFLGAGMMLPIVPKSFGKSSIKDVVNMWTPGAIETCGGTWDGQYYGIPFELSDYVAWINVAFMKEAGLNPATDKPKTWDDFVAVGKKLIKVEGRHHRPQRLHVQLQGRRLQLPRPAEHDGAAGPGLGHREGPGGLHGQPEGPGPRPADLHRLRGEGQDLGPGAGGQRPRRLRQRQVRHVPDRRHLVLGRAGHLLRAAQGREPFPYPRFKDGKDIGGVGYGYCLYVSKFAKDPELTFKFLDTMASQPNEFIKQGYHQPRVKLSNGAQALDPALATKSIPFYNEVFKGELAKTAVWLSSTKGAQVEDAVWAAISRVIYEGASVEDSVATFQDDIRAIEFSQE